MFLHIWRVWNRTDYTYRKFKNIVTLRELSGITNISKHLPKEWNVININVKRYLNINYDKYMYVHPYTIDFLCIKFSRAHSGNWRFRSHMTPPLDHTLKLPNLFELHTPSTFGPVSVTFPSTAKSPRLFLPSESVTKCLTCHSSFVFPSKPPCVL